MLGTDASISLVLPGGWGLCPPRNVLEVRVTHLKGHPPCSETQYFEEMRTGLLGQARHVS